MQIIEKLLQVFGCHAIFFEMIKFIRDYFAFNQKKAERISRSASKCNSIWQQEG